MKCLKAFLFLSLFCLPIGLFAQTSIVGDWSMQVPTEDGTMVPLQVSFKADNTYAVDFGADGRVEITGTYQLDGNQMTVQDDEGAQCTEKGVYRVDISATEMSMTTINEACDNRKSPNGVMIMTRG